MDSLVLAGYMGLAETASKTNWIRLSFCTYPLFLSNASHTLDNRTADKLLLHNFCRHCCENVSSGAIKAFSNLFCQTQTQL